MNLNFAEALANLGTDAVFRIANEARSPAEYLGADLLPERNFYSYHVEAANMVVRTTMAGLVGMDSPYPPGGAVSVSKFLEETAKIALEVSLPEAQLRQLQTLLMQRMINNQPTTEAIQREALNFLNKVVLQAHFDRREWLRWQALTYGLIDWSFGGKQLYVDYGVPTANKLTHRTGNDAYGGSASKFWTDIFTLQERLKWNVQAYFLRTTTLNAILAQEANALEVMSQADGRVRIRKYRTVGGNTIPESDARYTVELVTYDLEGEVYDLENPGQTVTVPFLADGKIVAIGRGGRSGYVVGEGSTPDPASALEVGYTHMAPTVEGGGQPGMWADLYTPERRPMQINARSAENSLPVLLDPAKVAIASTALS